MKKIFAIWTALVLMLSCAALAEETASSEATSMVVYFSATGTTKAEAELIAEQTGAALYEIVPEEPYSSADLNYNNDGCRANREQNDDAARPAISGNLPDLTNVDTIYLGYPIWWGKAPKIIYTFLESVDVSGKTIIPFCTSGSSGIGGSMSAIRELAKDATVLDGQRVNNYDEKKLADWLNGLENP